MRWAALKWLRKVGILLLTVSLLFLPWFLDPSPEADQNPFVTGLEFIAGPSWPVIMAYSLSLLAYVVSRFSARKWAGFVPFIAAGFIYHFMHFAMTASLSYPGIERHVSSLESMVGIRALAGVWVNWFGLLALAAGLYAAFHSVKR